MELGKSPCSGEAHTTPSPNLQNPINGDELDSSCSTPYASAPSSPGRGPTTTSFFFSAPASPMHFILSSSAAASPPPPPPSAADLAFSSSFEFKFSSRSPSSTVSTVGSMISADEIFLNGQIRPMKPPSRLQRRQSLAPLQDLDEEDEQSKALEQPIETGREQRLRSRSVHRRARSMSPTRKTQFHWQEEEEERGDRKIDGLDRKPAEETETEAETSSTSTPSVSASTSRSSSGRGSKRWISLKELLYRSKSEGRGTEKEKYFWHGISFSPSKEKKFPPSEATVGIEKEKGKRQMPPAKKAVAGKAMNGVGRRRCPAPSPHEMLYTANRAQAEEMKKKTFLPYRQGLLGCLGFSSKSYGALNGFAKTLNPVPSRSAVSAVASLLRQWRHCKIDVMRQEVQTIQLLQPLKLSYQILPIESGDIGPVIDMYVRIMEYKSIVECVALARLAFCDIIRVFRGETCKQAIECVALAQLAFCDIIRVFRGETCEQAMPIVRCIVYMWGSPSLPHKCDDPDCSLESLTSRHP